MLAMLASKVRSGTAIRNQRFTKVVCLSVKWLCGCMCRCEGGREATVDQTSVLVSTLREVLESGKSTQSSSHH
ncbi:hypothetical protein NQZ68_039880 [Dissostichus eleginoides]|nr:hypothetical protein NQZ68_039880 [Dissostichus eleginoides]